MAENNPPEDVPNRLPHRTTQEVLAQAQRIFEARGNPPYPAGEAMTADEAEIISEFVFHWRPFFVEKKK